MERRFKLCFNICVYMLRPHASAISSAHNLVIKKYLILTRFSDFLCITELLFNCCLHAFISCSLILLSVRSPGLLYYRNISVLVSVINCTWINADLLPKNCCWNNKDCPSVHHSIPSHNLLILDILSKYSILFVFQRSLLSVICLKVYSSSRRGEFFPPVARVIIGMLINEQNLHPYFCETAFVTMSRDKKYDKHKK